MADQEQDQKDAQSEADKKVNVPSNVTIGQQVDYDVEKYASRNTRHAEILKRFGVNTYPEFEDALGNQFARAVVAYLLGDHDFKMLGSVLTEDGGDVVAKPADGAEKTALGADGEVGIADPTAQAQKDKDESGVTEEAQKQEDAAN